MKSPRNELQDLLDVAEARFADEMQRLILAVFENDRIAAFEAQERIAREVGDAAGLADLLGRRRALLEADAARRRLPRGEFVASAPRLRLFGRKVPEVPFAEAARDLAGREPRLAQEVARTGEPLWKAVQRIYREERGFAAARAADLTVTRRVQKFVASTLAGEGPDLRPDFVLSELGEWNRSYAETVFRTNMTTSYAAGRFQQAADPDVAEVIVGLRYVAVLDGDVRPNHRAAHGLVARQDDPVWDRISPPLGYNCRCTIELVDRFEAARAGLLDEDGRLPRASVPSGARPDRGFQGGRPDRIYPSGGLT